jgi:endoglucanase
VRNVCGALCIASPDRQLTARNRDLCQQIAFQRANSDVIIGVVAWSAGAFGSTYALDLTPTQNGNGWTDQPLVTSCLKNAH